ncbi:hypothetical protein NLG97_g7131 [Lecanicillium saksenae]|uniref:Uncharacterized protein n=1 Tax=Lecanicillium saksenae TaxID=468837 RepID=A0ACC1QMP6_9HYPO|nr:hypothetical protein NLG97_g7131 [Lecanicillium saksenae]
MLIQSFIVKADVAGSVEAVVGSILEQGNHEVQSKVLRSSAGQVTEYDVDLAAASKSIIVNFNTAVAPHIKQRADEAKVKILDHTVIYHVVDDVRSALGDLLPPLVTQRVHGEADILQVFPINITRRVIRNIAGCRVRNGSIKKGTKVKVLRKGKVIYDGTIDTIRHGKKDVQEMGKGTECGIGLEDFEEFQEDDQLQTYEVISEKRRLEDEQSMATVRRSLPTWRPPRQTRWQRFRRNPALFLAQHLYPYRATKELHNSAQDAVSVVCISDTHNTRPNVPDGDLLLHAGDLTIGGSYVELQAQLDWLNTLPHRYKVVIAGNHDLLLDPAFVDRSPDRIYEGEGTSRGDLDWGTVLYLNNTATTLTFFNGRSIKVYGSPWTPMFGNWAFQYPEVRVVWPDSVPHDIDILLTHGPPKGHLDDQGKGCAQLLKEISRVRPKLVVFGHIHVARGREEVHYDRVQQAYDRIMDGKGGFWGALLMLFWLIVGRIRKPFSGVGSATTTTLVNAAVVGQTMDRADHNGTVVNM